MKVKSVVFFVHRGDSICIATFSVTQCSLRCKSINEDVLLEVREIVLLYYLVEKTALVFYP